MADMKESMLNSDADSSEDKAQPEELKPHFMGHHFHWSEGFFAVMTLIGFLTFFASAGGAALPEIIMGVLFCLSSATACALIWNLVSIKRIAAATDMIEKDVKTFKAENEKARNMQAEKRRQDEEMKDRLNKMEKAELLLSASARSLEGIAKAEEEMMGEREEMLKERKRLTGLLERDLKELHEITLRTARLELEDRAQLYFDEIDKDSDGMQIGSTEWKQLCKLMEINGIELHASAAGDDDILTKDEFDKFIDDSLDVHFEKLGEALKRNEQLKEEILSLEMEQVV
jgi:hypothetical protein